MFCCHSVVYGLEQSTAKHVGSKTCGQSTCHAADKPWANSAVQQKEYVIWSTRDRHAKAYKTLKTEFARTIAGKLGIKDPSEHNLCLNCHSNNIKPELRGRDFDISNGVGCETCHGGAEKWLTSHSSGKTLPGENFRKGMYPTPDPLARGELCMSCHATGTRRGVSHRLLAAGHPRLPFELDTYTISQPAHFKNDADYRVRKALSSGTTVWAMGQAVQAEKILSNLSKLTKNPKYVFSEFSLFDCHSCHQVADTNTAVIRQGGIPRINDAYFAMSQIVAAYIDTDLGERIKGQIKSLHSATRRGWNESHSASQALHQSIISLIEKIKASKLDHKDATPLMDAIFSNTISGQFDRYLVIEQSILAVGTLVDAQRRAGLLSDPEYKIMREELARCYSATQDDESFKLSVIKSAFANMQKALPTS